jgi:uncharacterized protein YndB with AHSA1/START domain
VKPPTFHFTASTTIKAPPDQMWATLVDIEDWWIASNPEHDHFTVLTDGPLLVGSGIRVRERIAGIAGQAEGRIVDFEPGRRVGWRADAVYRYLGFDIPIDESVTWTIAETGDLGQTRLSVRVWARFSNSWRGRLIFRFFKGILRGVDRDRRHARRELNYLKQRLEGTL